MICLLLPLLSLFSQPAFAQETEPKLPDPIKFVVKYDMAWKATRRVLEEMDYKIELQDRNAGRILTKPHEFIIGSLTASEVEKVAVLKETTGTWMKARYSVEALLEIVTPTTTMVTISTNMEGLQRELDGSESWVEFESLGTFEKRILGKISQKVYGNDLGFDDQKGFWDKTPQPVDSRSRFPTRPPL